MQHLRTLELESFTMSETDHHLLRQKVRQSKNLSNEDKHWCFCCLQDKK